MVARPMAITMEEAGLGNTLARARAGDQQGFAELYTAYYRRVLGLCRRMLGKEEDAEDAAAEIFLKVQRSLVSHDPSQPLLPWLLSVASHHCIDRLRRRNLEERLFAEEDVTDTAPRGAEPSPLSQVLGSEERKRLRALLDALPAHYRVSLVLRYYSEMSYVEIARTLGLGRNQVALLIFRAKRTLRRQIVGAKSPVRKRSVRAAVPARVLQPVAAVTAPQYAIN